jgi:hypothetical protein
MNAAIEKYIYSRGLHEDKTQFKGAEESVKYDACRQCAGLR